MSISIITPHYNDLEGLQGVFQCLQDQTAAQWEWVVVDDLSSAEVKKDLQAWITNLNHDQIRVIYATAKTNASQCRNAGAAAARFERLVFLDSDDLISKEFVAHRLIPCQDFVVFKNNATLDKTGTVQIAKNLESDYLNCYLKAKFIWPITAVLWEKSFFNALGGFHPKLPRLQDVELMIRGLQKSSSYQVIDNPVDFYYKVIPIRDRKNFLSPVCTAVHLFLSEILDQSQLNREQVQLLSGYYYLCTKYLERSGSTEAIHPVKQILKVTYRIGAISFMKWVGGQLLLQLYTRQVISPSLFLRINRKIFKPR